MTADQPHNPAAELETVFGRTYAETVELLIQTRDYIAQNEELARRRGGVADRLAYAHETLRLTTRLAQVMAWILVRHAVHTGEISSDEARSEGRRLGARELCHDDDERALALLPPYFRSLTEHAGALYRRIARLDDLAAGGGATPPSFDFL